MDDLHWLEGKSGDPGGGPFIVLRFGVLGTRVVETSFQCNGCPAAQMSACGIATFARGRTIDQLLRLEASDLLVLIGGLPDGKGHYADMAVEALKVALALPNSNSA